MQKLSRRDVLRGTGVAALAAGAAVVPFVGMSDFAVVNELEGLFSEFEKWNTELHRRMALTDTHFLAGTVTDEIWEYQFAVHDPQNAAFRAICAYRCRTPEERRIKAAYLLNSWPVKDAWDDMQKALLQADAEEVRA